MNIDELSNEEKFHLINGIWSNIPPCCIKFFIEKNRREEFIWEFLNKTRGCHQNVWYVQCNSCYEKKINVEILDNGIIGMELFHR